MHCETLFFGWSQSAFICLGRVQATIYLGHWFLTTLEHYTFAIVWFCFGWWFQKYLFSYFSSLGMVTTSCEPAYVLYFLGSWKRQAVDRAWIFNKPLLRLVLGDAPGVIGIGQFKDFDFSATLVTSAGHWWSWPVNTDCCEFCQRSLYFPWLWNVIFDRHTNAGKPLKG